VLQVDSSLGLFRLAGAPTPLSHGSAPVSALSSPSILVTITSVGAILATFLPFGRSRARRPTLSRMVSTTRVPVHGCLSVGMLLSGHPMPRTGGATITACLVASTFALLATGGLIPRLVSLEVPRRLAHLDSYQWETNGDVYSNSSVYPCLV
jgi:hypothetical protein